MQEHKDIPTLPDTLSGVLTLGIEAMQELDRRTYHPDSEVWHIRAVDNKPCYVCLAGAVMSRYYEPDEMIRAEDVSNQLKRVAFALDALTKGYVVKAANHLEIEVDPRWEHRMRRFPDYEFFGWEQADRKLEDMRWLRDLLIQEEL